MPPEGEPRPAPAEHAILDAWLDATLGMSPPAARRLALRRLNRAEYNNTIRDLIGLDLHPADDFPADDVGYGFDNIGDVLATPPSLIEQYLNAAERVIDQAFRDPTARACIMSPPPDALPLAMRAYTPPARSPRGDKVLRTQPPAPDPELARQQGVYKILCSFADRAFRRPVTHDETTRLLAIVMAAENDGEPPESAIRLALQAALVSPHFLFHVEDDRERARPRTTPQDTDFGLASRLSYFLWSSMPDEELLRLAAQARLRRGDVLRAQTLRMLADRKSRALAVNFASQWLQTRRLREFTPDPTLFPDFDESLRVAMLRETELFCLSIQAEDRSALDFLDSADTFVNERLARHYGISGVVGSEFRRVSLIGTYRGGVVTQASVLAVTSNPTRTSPVKRGQWILDNLLGAPPAPPPSGVEALKEGPNGGPPGTLRQRLERHRADAACAGCHARMDPLGFALENFDALGRFRTHDGGQPVDASGKLPDQPAFNGPAGLREALWSRRQAFIRRLSEKMLIYALGRGLEQADRGAVDQIAAWLARGDYRFSALILAVVASEPFRDPGGRP